MLDRLSVLGGLRYTMFIPQGSTAYKNLEPRISSRYLLTEASSIKASYSIMNQYLHLLSNSTPGLPTDLWVPSTQRVKPQRSEQYAIGFNKEIFSKGLEFSLESYYKKSSNIIAYKDGATFLINSVTDFQIADTVNYEDQVVSGSGYSKGIEFFVKYQNEKFNGWIGYTISKTRVRFDDINEGIEFAPKYDRLHDVSVVGSYKFSEKTRLSATWIFSTGNALTVPVAQYTATNTIASYNNTVNYYGPRGSFRAAPYHRLDISIQKTKQKKHGIRTWEYGLYNAYFRANPFFYFIGESDYLAPYDPNAAPSNKLSLYKVALFPIIPSVTYSYKF